MRERLLHSEQDQNGLSLPRRTVEPAGLCDNRADFLAILGQVGDPEFHELEPDGRLAQAAGATASGRVTLF
jgi:hypothetical protein